MSFIFSFYSSFTNLNDIKTKNINTRPLDFHDEIVSSPYRYKVENLALYSTYTILCHF